MRPRPSAAAVTVAVVLLLLPVAGDMPAAALAAARAERVRDVAVEAERALGHLAIALDAALSSGRDGTSRVVAGEEAPEPYLEAAAEQLVLAGAAARSAQHATDALGGSLAAVLPDARLGGAVPGADELAGIAGQLRASAEAAGPFVERRRATGSVLAALRDALAALDRDDAPAALVALDDAEAALAVVEGWEAPPNVLPIWLDTTRELLGAARRLAEAIVAGDPGAAEAAAADYAAAAEEGRQADTALAIAIAEAGSGIAGTPLRRLTTVRSDLEELRLSVASVLQAGD